MSGEKRVENRTWSTKHRGQLGIHAGKSKAWKMTGRELAGPFGVLLGYVTLVDCVHINERSRIIDCYPWMVEDEFVSGPWCWVLADPWILKDPVPMTGKLSLWECKAPRSLYRKVHGTPVGVVTQPRRY